MADQHGADEAFSTDMQLIEELAAGLRMSRWPGDSDTIVELGNLEDTSILAVRNGVFTYEPRVGDSARFKRRSLGAGRPPLPGHGTVRVLPVRQSDAAAGHETARRRKQARGRADRTSADLAGGEATFYRQSSAVTFSGHRRRSGHHPGQLPARQR